MEQRNLQEAIVVHDEAIGLDLQDARAYVNRALAFTLLEMDISLGRRESRLSET